MNPEELTEVSAIVIGTESVNDGTLKAITEKDFGIPVFLMLEPGDDLPEEAVGQVLSIINPEVTDKLLYARQIDEAATKYEQKLLPPFFGSLMEYVQQGNAQFVARDIRAVPSSVAILPVALSTISLVKKFSVRTFAMLTFPWVIF